MVKPKWTLSIKHKQRSGKDSTVITADTCLEALNKGVGQYCDRYSYKYSEIEWMTIFPEGEVHA